MSTQIQYRRGTSAQNDSFIGALAEITVDTTNKTLRVHDGATAGGFTTVGLATSQSLSNKTLVAPVLSGNVTGTSNINISGNITGSYFFGNGSQLTGIDATQIQNGTSNVKVPSSGSNVTISVNGTPNVAVITATGANITGTLNATGNANLGNIGATNVVLAGALSGVTTISASGNANVGNVGATNAVFTNISGTLTTAAQTNITSVGTLTSLSVSGAVTGASLSVSTGNITGGNLLLSGAIEDSAQLDIRTTASNGNIVLTPNGTGVVVAAKDIVNGQANGVGNIGSATGFFNTVFAKATSAQYADLAEKYVADADYAVGTVLIIGGDAEVTQSKLSHSTAVVGTVSENPATVMNAGLESSHVAVVALVGRVPCKVIGSIRKGDLLASSTTPGVAMALDQLKYRPGCVVGKALQNYDSDQEGTIEILVGRL